MNDLSSMCYLIGFVMPNVDLNKCVHSVSQRQPPIWVYTSRLNTLEVFAIGDQVYTEVQWEAFWKPLVQNAVNVQSMLLMSNKNEAESCVDKIINKWKKENANMVLPENYYNMFTTVSNGIMHFYDERNWTMSKVAIYELRRRVTCFQKIIDNIRTQKMELIKKIQLARDVLQLSEKLESHQRMAVDTPHQYSISNTMHFHLEVKFDSVDADAMEDEFMELLSKEHLNFQKIQRVNDILDRNARNQATRILHAVKNRKRKAATSVFGLEE